MLFVVRSFRITAYFTAVGFSDVLVQPYRKFNGSFPVQISICSRYLCCKQMYCLSDHLKTHALPFVLSRCLFTEV